jgi:hypothetical protein
MAGRVPPPSVVTDIVKLVKELMKKWESPETFGAGEDALIRSIVQPKLNRALAVGRSLSTSKKDLAKEVNPELTKQIKAQQAAKETRDAPKAGMIADDDRTGVRAARRGESGSMKSLAVGEAEAFRTDPRSATAARNRLQGVKDTERRHVRGSELGTTFIGDPDFLSHPMFGHIRELFATESPGSKVIPRDQRDFIRSIILNRLMKGREQKLPGEKVEGKLKRHLTREERDKLLKDTAPEKQSREDSLEFAEEYTEEEMFDPEVLKEAFGTTEVELQLGRAGKTPSARDEAVKLQRLEEQARAPVKEEPVRMLDELTGQVDDAIRGSEEVAHEGMALEQSTGRRQSPEGGAFLALEEKTGDLSELQEIRQLIEALGGVEALEKVPGGEQMMQFFIHRLLGRGNKLGVFDRPIDIPTGPPQGSLPFKEGDLFTPPTPKSFVRGEKDKVPDLRNDRRRQAR